MPEERINCGFTVLVDSNESHPWTFRNIRADAKHKNKLIDVKTKWQSLGRYPNSLGDYSIEGCLGEIHIERKSVEDIQGTILGWQTSSGNGSSRRVRFAKELENLAEVPVSAVIIEGTTPDVLRCQRTGKQDAKTVSKILFRSILAFQSDYKVPWIFAGSRRNAEVACFRIMDRFWRKREKSKCPACDGFGGIGFVGYPGPGIECGRCKGTGRAK